MSQLEFDEPGSRAPSLLWELQSTNSIKHVSSLCIIIATRYARTFIFKRLESSYINET